MKRLLLAYILFSSLQTLAQNSYWQQYLHYSINATLNDKEKTVTGSETIVYINHSPDTLFYIWFHIYPNAYKDQSTALFQQIRNDLARKDKIKKYTEGSISNLAFTVNGAAATTEPHPNPQYLDIIKLVLPKPLLPNDSATIATPYKVKLPSYFSRSGYADEEFMICQWYPKPAVYDKEGWHEMPYLDMGEFYSEYASYKVNLTVPSAYVVSATGKLHTAAEEAAYKTIGRYNAEHRNVDKPKLYIPAGAKASKTLTYVADSVPDFAWFADKNFIIQYDTIQLSTGKIIDAYTWYHNNRNSPWGKSIDFVKDAVQHYSEWIGEYSYPVVQAVEGPANNSSGGMEYPMVTLITSPDAKPASLDMVIAHEVGHNWFMSMLGTNERAHAWMDEGLNSYYQFRYEAEKYRANSVFGDNIPPAVKKLGEEDFQGAMYKVLLQVPINAPLETPSANFASSDDYGLTSYLKGSIWMYILEQSAGKEKVDKAFQNYFRLWKFKHPTPEDLKASFEEAINRNLDDFFSLLHKEGKLVQ